VAKLKKNRKIIAILPSVILASLVPGPTAAKGIRVELRGGYFSPSEQAFREIYGGGPAYGADVVVGIWKRLDLWVGGGYFYKKGELSFTAEETFVKVRSFGWGVRYGHSLGRFDLYGGAGLDYFLYDEENPIGEASAGKIGPEFRAGAFYRLTGRFSAGAFASFTTCVVSPAQYEFNLGGLSAGLVLSYRLGK